MLNNWKNNLQSILEAAPFIEQAIEYAKWQLEFSEAHDGNDLEMNHPFEMIIKGEFEFLVGLIPQLPKYSYSPLISATPVTTSIELYNTINNSNAAARNEILRIYAQKYEHIQEADITKEKISEMLRKYLLEEFNIGERSYSAYNLLLIEQQAVGITMRNVLERLKGRLFALVRRRHEQKITWRTYFERVSTFPKDSNEHLMLLKYEQVFTDLHDKLTNIAKNNKSIESSEELQVIHTNYINHIYTLLLISRHVIP
jgi:hypothetical protein